MSTSVQSIRPNQPTPEWLTIAYTFKATFACSMDTVRRTRARSTPSGSAPASSGLTGKRSLAWARASFTAEPTREFHCETPVASQTAIG